MNSSYIIMILSVLIASTSQILLKAGANKSYSSFIRQYLNVYVIVGYGLTFISMFLTILALRELEYKIAPLIESTGFIFVLIFSRIFFREKITFKKFAGACIILTGIFIYYL